MSPSGPTPPDQDLHPADFEPEDVRYIRDVDTLRAISDPTRMRILEAMVQRRSPAWSVKELAAALEMPQTRLYHHVDLLLAQDLIRAVERRVVSGIIETRYNVAARSFQLDRALFAGGSAEGFAVLSETLAAVFDTARAEVELAIRLGVINPGAETPAERGLMLTRGLARLTPARAARAPPAPPGAVRRSSTTTPMAPDPATEPGPTASSSPSTRCHPPRSLPMTDVPVAPRVGVRDLLRIPDFRRLFLAQAISDLGDGMTYLALFLLVLDLTGSTAAIALMAILLAVPPVTIGLFAGAYADRHDRRRIMIVSDTLRAGVVVAMVSWPQRRALPALFVLAYRPGRDRHVLRAGADRHGPAGRAGAGTARRQLAGPGDTDGDGRGRRRRHRASSQPSRASRGRCS